MERDATAVEQLPAVSSVQRWKRFIGIAETNIQIRGLAEHKQCYCHGICRKTPLVSVSNNELWTKWSTLTNAAKAKPWSQPNVRIDSSGWSGRSAKVHLSRTSLRGKSI